MRASDSSTFLELLHKLHEQHLLELRALRGENAQLRLQVKSLEAACVPSQGVLDDGRSETSSSTHSDGNISFLEAGFADQTKSPPSSSGRAQQAWEAGSTDGTEPPAGGAGRTQRAWPAAQAEGGAAPPRERGLSGGAQDSEALQQQRSLVQRMAGVVPGGAMQKEAVHLFDVPLQPRARSFVLAFVEDLIQRPSFEALFGALILSNALVMAAEAQYSGLLLGARIDHASAKDVDAAVLWRDAPLVFEVFGWFFGLAFLAEVALKVIGLRSRFPCAAWNWIDSVIVVLWVISIFGANLPLDPNLIRLARLARLLRLLRLAHKIQGFDSLYLISTSIASSVSILAWGSVMFFLCQMALALLLSNVLAEVYFKDPNEPLENLQTVYTYFGTFSRALFSMFEITLGNWPPMSRMLAERVSEWFMLFGVLHKLTLGFAFVGVVNGVFMQETFKVAATDDKVMIRQKQRVVDTHTKKMRWLFNRAAGNGGETVDRAAFKEVVSHPKVSMWLASMELDEKDHDLLFSLLDDGDGELTLPELVKGVARLKGAARSIDLVQVMRQVGDIRTMLETAGFKASQRCRFS